MAKKYIRERNVQFGLLIADLITLISSIAIAYYIRINIPLTPSADVFMLTFILLACFYLLGVYTLRPRILIWRELGKFLAAVLLSGMVFAAIVYIMRKDIVGVFGRGVFLGSLMLFTVIGSLIRIAIFKWLQTHLRNLRWLVIGSKKHIEYLMSDFKNSHTMGTLYFLSDDDLSDLAIDRRFLLGKLDQLPNLTQNYWTGVAIASTENDLQKMGSNLMKLRLRGNRIFDLATFYEYLWFKVPIHYLNSSWFAFTEGFGLLHSSVGLRIKNLGDVLAATALMIVTSPILILGALAVKLSSRGPAIYSQVRTGQGGEDFVIYKLRTMANDAEKNGAQWAQKNDHRITKVGKFLRLTRIDELPQLWNVIKGDMSFIGPRPERPEFNEKLSEEIPYYNMRNLLKPGVTGWAQVMYSYGSSTEDSKEKLQYDLYYIKNYSLLLDWNICLKTVRVILGAKGQ